MSQVIRSYRDLVVWRKGLDLIGEVDGIVESFNSYQRWSLGMHCKYLPDVKTEAALGLLNEIGRMLRSLSGRIREDALAQRRR